LHQIRIVHCVRIRVLNNHSAHDESSSSSPITTTNNYRFDYHNHHEPKPCLNILLSFFSKINLK
jgi:hypothetical protein